jgi:hypothetical protein
LTHRGYGSEAEICSEYTVRRDGAQSVAGAAEEGSLPLPERLGRAGLTNRAIGIAWDGYYGATFINSFGDRAFSAGVQGTLARWEPGRTTVGLGYRAGLITGYDEPFIPLAGKTPVVPLVQPLLLVDGQRLGLELSYSGVIASAALNVRF